ncbi:helix-turn-helix transcriptional regulator [Alloalcanivorax balearicus]|uniref:helix-turn-helix transcriptional regulator n=1 Tax=Alloalcanivorax balearicus TaxID=413232 RepID=UPI003742BE1C
MAQQLSVSERTLHRELSHEGTRFRDVLDGVRFERARTLLRESNAPLDTLAARIGLQSRQSFIRWFRQHTGTTPDRYRKGLHND